jgi:hypothetical protein
MKKLHEILVLASHPRIPPPLPGAYGHLGELFPGQMDRVSAPLGDVSGRWAAVYATIEGKERSRKREDTVRWGEELNSDREDIK